MLSDPFFAPAQVEPMTVEPTECVKHEWTTSDGATPICPMGVSKSRSGIVALSAAHGTNGSSPNHIWPEE